MIPSNRVVMFYDGACPMCRREVMHYRKLDSRQRIEWVDLTRQPEVLTELDPPVTYMAAMTRLHVLDSHGQMRTGAYAFVTLWRELPGYRWLARILTASGLTPFLDRCYDHFTRWRLRNRCLAGNKSCQ